MKLCGVEAIPVAYPKPDNLGTRHLLFVRVTADDGQVWWRVDIDDSVIDRYRLDR